MAIVDQPGKMIHLKIRNKDGDLQTVKIKPDVAAFNVGVNELALKLGFGLKASDRYNAEALHQLLGNDLRPEARPGGWVGEWLAQYPDNYEVVNTLARRLRISGKITYIIKMAVNPINSHNALPC